MNKGDGAFNRNWQIAQGSIIANSGPKLEDIHPLIMVRFLASGASAITLAA